MPSNSRASPKRSSNCGDPQYWSWTTTMSGCVAGMLSLVLFLAVLSSVSPGDPHTGGRNLLKPSPRRGAGGSLVHSRKCITAWLPRFARLVTANPGKAIVRPSSCWQSSLLLATSKKRSPSLAAMLSPSTSSLSLGIESLTRANRSWAYTASCCPSSRLSRAREAMLMAPGATRSTLSNVRMRYTVSSMGEPVAERTLRFPGARSGAFSISRSCRTPGISMASMRSSSGHRCRTPAGLAPGPAPSRHSTGDLSQTHFTPSFHLPVPQGLRLMRDSHMITTVFAGCVSLKREYTPETLCRQSWYFSRQGGRACGSVLASRRVARDMSASSGVCTPKSHSGVKRPSPASSPPPVRRPGSRPGGTEADQLRLAAPVSTPREPRARCAAGARRPRSAGRTAEPVRPRRSSAGPRPLVV
mmetsp:Transcript_5335/g.12995  ORF Transcript_5335/g.12995 Transcript_5335/m.12995 type:complete len:414 (+) Transcript_5335:706-1947(+)